MVKGELGVKRGEDLFVYPHHYIFLGSCHNFSEVNNHKVALLIKLLLADQELRAYWEHDLRTNLTSESFERVDISSRLRVNLEDYIVVGDVTDWYGLIVAFINLKS